MIGRSGKPNRPPLQIRTAAHTASLRQVNSPPSQLRIVRRRDLSHLDLEFARKVADVKLRLRGDELMAALAALRSEHKAARKALLAKLVVKSPVRRPRCKRYRPRRYPSPT